MKKRVRIYKAGGQQGKVVNPTAKWMAQIGGQQQNQLEQVYAFVAQSMMQGNDPDTVIMQLIEAGIDQVTATDLVNSVAEQLGSKAEQSSPQVNPTMPQEGILESFDSSPEVSYESYYDSLMDTEDYNEAEELINSDENEFMQTGGNTVSPEELVLSQFTSQILPDQSLAVDPMSIFDQEILNQIAFPSVQDYMVNYIPVSEAKKGGSTKKKILSNILKAFEEGGDVTDDTIGRGNMMDTETDQVKRKKEGFLNSIKTQAKEARAEELYNLMLNSSNPQMQQTAMNFGSEQFMQTGGFTDTSNPDLYRFVYGGGEPFYEADFLPEAQQGEEVRRATINYIPQRRTVPGGLFRSLYPFNPVRSVRYIPFTFNAGQYPELISLDQKNLKNIYQSGKKARPQVSSKKDKTKDSKLKFYTGSLFPGFQGSAFAREQVVTPDVFDVYDNKYSFETNAPSTMPDYNMAEYIDMPNVQPEQGYYPSKNMLRNIISKFAFSQGGYLPKAQFNNSQVGSPINWKTTGNIRLNPIDSPTLDNPWSIDQSWSNPITGKSPGITYNSETGEYENDLLADYNSKKDPNKQMFGILKQTTTDPEAGVMAVDTALNAAAGFIERMQTPKPRQFYGDDIAASASKQYNVGTWDVNSGLFRPNYRFSGVVQKGGFLPQAKTGQQVQGALAIQPTAMGGADIDQYIGKPNLKLSRFLTSVPRDEANLEAEGGETAYGDINGDGLPEHKIIKGARHANGGVPLSLPDDTFIFSDYKRGSKGEKSMKISDPNVLAQFGKSVKNGKKGKGFTPAELAKQYDVDKYRKILQDPNSDKMSRDTAELMIKNYTLKLGALALAQESKKGFPQGIPVAALPYMEHMGLRPEDVLPQDMINTIDQLKAQEEQSIAQAQTMGSPTGYEDAMMAQDLNQGQPVAMPGNMMEGMPMAQYGMQMGGYDLPFATYGMSMGANPNNYMGRTPSYAKGGYLPKHQTTGAVNSGREVVINRANYDSDADFQKAIYIAQKQGNAVYVVDNGTRKKVSGYKYGPPSIEGMTTSDFGDTKDQLMIAAQYNLLEESLKDPFVRQQIVEQTKAALQDKEAYKSKPRNGQPGIYGRTWTSRGYGMPSEDQIINSFLTHQKRNLMLAAKGFDPQYLNDAGTDYLSASEMVRKGFAKNTAEANQLITDLKSKFGNNATEISRNLGIPLGSEQDRMLEQATYHGYVRTLQKKNKGEYSPEQEYSLRYFNISPNAPAVGTTDEKSMTSLYGTDQISPIDAVQGNTTLGHRTAVGDFSINYDNSCQCADGTTKERDANGKCPCEEKVQKKCPCQQSDGTIIDTGVNPNTGECNPCEENITIPIEETAPWWLQDTIKTAGAFGDLMSINKYMPWAPKVDFEEPSPVYLDPTRELAQQSEQANIITEGLAQFVGPQALSARSSQVQGQGAKQAADTLARYNNANVNMANQFAMKIADIRNQEQAANQAIASRLYDQTTIANQQFDNAKRQARANLGNYYTNAITNRAKTDALNQLYPQYAVDPSTGGFMNFTQGKALTGSGTTTASYGDVYAQCRAEGVREEDLWRCAQSKMGNSGETNPYAEAQAAYAAQYAGMTPGYSQKGGQNSEGYYVFGNFDFPFIL